MDFYLLAFMLIILVGSVFVYIYYLKEKKEQLDSIRRGFCPKCKQNALLSFECISCGYANSFAVDNSGSCGTDRCC